MTPSFIETLNLNDLEPHATLMTSACLLGVACRYDGASRGEKRVLDLAAEYSLVPFCPEQLGGLPTPRPPAEIRGGDGGDVIRGQARVERVEDGGDVTAAFIRGAEESMKIAEVVGAVGFLFKGGSPSCGWGRVVGVCAAMAVARGFWVREFP